jgi:hypothetical protein
LRFALKIRNPLLPQKQYSIPLIIYTFDPILLSKTNYNLVNGAAFIYDPPFLPGQVPTYASTTSGQL